MVQSTVTAIVPTIGRPESLGNLLDSLRTQTLKVDEVVIADASPSDETTEVISNPKWLNAGLLIHHLRVNPPNAVVQRTLAIGKATGELLLLLDDDVVLEPDCVEQMAFALAADRDAVAVMADFENESWSRPTRVWRWYLRHVLKLKEDEWQGRVLGPLLRFGFYIPQTAVRSIEWLGTGNSLIRRDAFDLVGGFSNFFLHRCTINEDVDLGIKLAKVGTILFSPKARLSHYHALAGRMSPIDIAEDDLHNRFLILRRTVMHTTGKALRLVLLFHMVETSADLAGIIRLRNFSSRLGRIYGRSRAMRLILSSLLFPDRAHL